jgi:hypothetical protein
VTDHDAYTTGGGWGSFYDPDVADWNHYQLTLDGTNDEWYLEYRSDSGEPAVGAPMSGDVDWDHDYAVETGIGDYDDYAGCGGSACSAENEGYALSNPWSNGDGKAAWDMDWSWGSEYIPLGYPGFDITVELDLDGGTTDRVTLTPACMPVWLEFVDGNDWVEVGETETINVMMSGSGFNSAELDLLSQDSKLNGGSVSEGSMWSGYSSNVMQNETSGGHVYFKDYVDDQDTTLGGVHMQVAQFELIGENDQDDATITLQGRIRISDLDGNELPVCGEDDTLTVHGHGTVEGDVQLQGRFVSGGDTNRHTGATVTIEGGPGGGFSYSTTTDADGHWSIGGIEGAYSVKVEMELYLSAERPSDVSFVYGGGLEDAGFVKLLGGDCNLPGNEQVGGGDAAVVATYFGETGVTASDPADPADINDDGDVDILDCSILGGNYGLVGPTTAPW